VEFACPACKAVLRLVPYGNGRYAVPGEPPPPPPSEEDRRVPWRRARTEDAPPPRTTAERKEEPRPEPTAAPPPRRAAPASGGRETRVPPPEPSAAEEPVVTVDSPLDANGALEVLGLRIGATHKEIERAYRARALQCHPDKVAHLDPEFVALAERKFRRLQAARDLLLGA
jgi:hypothetical protein